MAANFGSDPWVDARLRNVPLPVGMLSRLSQIGNPSNDDVDAALREVPLPAGMLDRLQRIARTPRRRVAWRELSLAASVLLAVGVGYISLVASFLTSTYPPERREPQIASQATTAAGLSAEDLAAGDNIALGPADLAGSERNDDWEDADLSPAAPYAVADDPVADDAMLGMNDFRPLPLPGVRYPRPRNLPFAFHGEFDHLPDLEMISRPAQRGLRAPLGPGYDLLYQIKTGQRPFVSPAAHPALSSALIPLGQETTSFRLAQQYLAQGRWPAVEDIRIEDFLAALDDLYPPAESKLVIRTAAGPAPFGEPGLRLLEVGVQAGRIADPAREAVDLTIAVDTSASMRHGARLAIVRQAIRRLAGDLAASDRVTLIGFSDYAQLLLENVSAGSGVDLATRDRWLAAIDALRPDNATNVGAGIELASTTIRRAGAEPGRRRCLVLLSDGLAELDTDANQQVKSLLGGLSSEGVKLDVVDVSGDREISPPLAELAEAGAGRARRAVDANEIAALLADALAGAPQTVSHSTALKVTFNPQVVHSYRLVGHATTTITGPASAATQVDLRAGSQATGLFEVWLQPGGGDDVATAELTWHEPGGSAAGHLTQRISRLQFAKSFAESPLSLQAAAIAAETARMLRGHGALPGRSSTRLQDLARLEDMAAQAHPRLSESESFRQLVELIAQAAKVHSGGATVRRGAATLKPQ
jgi:Ca-activated chloride channel homolog